MDKVHTIVHPNNHASDLIQLTVVGRCKSVQFLSVFLCLLLPVLLVCGVDVLGPTHQWHQQCVAVLFNTEDADQPILFQLTFD